MLVAGGLRFNRYPFDYVVSFILNNFGNTADRSLIRILDLGCGGGNHTAFLAQEGFDVSAVDGSAKSIEITRQFTAGKCDPKKIIQAEFTHLPFPDGYFSCVVDRHSLGHNETGILNIVIDEIYRVLQPGKGIYLGMVFSANHPHRCFGKFRLENSLNDMHEFKLGNFKQSGIVHFFTIQEIIERFHRFTIEDVIMNSTRSLFGASDSPDNAETFTIKAKRPGLTS